MRLYELDNDKCFVIKDDPSITRYKLVHIDGMYSYCYRLSDNTVHHIIAFAQVEEVPCDG